MKKHRVFGIGLAAIVFAVSSFAAEDPVGEWKGEGARGEITIVISKDAGGSLTGQMITGRGSNDLTNVKFEGGLLSFVNVLEFNGQTFELSFTGKLDGDTYMATINTPGGENTIELTRGGGSGGIKGLVGVWNLTGESQFGPMEHKLIVMADGKATYESSGQVSDVTNLVIEGNKVNFEMTTYGGGGSYDVAFAGSFDDEGLTGDVMSNGASFVTLKAPRDPGIGAMVGTWNLTGESQYGPMDHTLVVTADGKFTYGSEGEVSEVSNLKIDGSSVSFDMTVYGGGNAYEVSFQGSFGEDGLTGDVMTGGNSFATLNAPKAE